MCHQTIWAISGKRNCRIWYVHFLVLFRVVGKRGVNGERPRKICVSSKSPSRVLDRDEGVAGRNEREQHSPWWGSLICLQASLWFLSAPPIIEPWLDLPAWLGYILYFLSGLECYSFCVCPFQLSHLTWSLTVICYQKQSFTIVERRLLSEEAE